jgi:hypothetical protein
MADSLSSLELSSEEIRALAERAYPGLTPSGFCSYSHGSTAAAVACTVCYPDLRALIDEHVRVRQEQVAQLTIERDEVREALKDTDSWAWNKIMHGRYGPVTE